MKTDRNLPFELDELKEGDEWLAAGVTKIWKLITNLILWSQQKKINRLGWVFLIKEDFEEVMS